MNALTAIDLPSEPLQDTYEELLIHSLRELGLRHGLPSPRGNRVSWIQNRQQSSLIRWLGVRTLVQSETTLEDLNDLAQSFGLTIRWNTQARLIDVRK